MSLADELLADLDGLSDDGHVSEQETTAQPEAGPSKPRAVEGDNNEDEEDEDMDQGNVEAGAKLADGTSATGYVPSGGVRPADELDRDEVEGMNLQVVEDVESVVKLHRSRKLLETLEQIEHFVKEPSDTSIEAGPIEENPEYSLIVASNNLSVEVDNELLLVHKVSWPCNRRMFDVLLIVIC